MALLLARVDEALKSIYKLVIKLTVSKLLMFLYTAIISPIHFNPTLYFFLIYIHSLLHKLESGKDKLDRKDVLVVDEAGMLDTQLMLRITRAVSKAGAKMVLVGDRPAPIYSDRWAVAGDADPGGYREISTVRRQQNEVDRQATLDLARGRIGDAYNSYKARGFVSNPIPPAMSFILRGRVD